MVNFLFQGSLEIFHAGSTQKFSIKMWLKIFRHGLVDRYATFKQGPEGRLKFSGQSPANFFQSRSARNSCSDLIGIPEPSNAYSIVLSSVSNSARVSF